MATDFQLQFQKLKMFSFWQKYFNSFRRNFKVQYILRVANFSRKEYNNILYLIYEFQKKTLV